MTEQDQYDFGASTPTRKTLISYNAPGDFPRPTEVQILDASGVKQADTTIAYDEGTLVASGITTQLSTPSRPRGNPTTISRWIGDSGWVTEKRTYYDTGKLATDTDPNQNTTNYFYDAAYAGAWLTKIQRPSTGSVQHVVSFAYDPATGLMTSSTDENGNVTRYAYADPMDRLTQITEPAVPLNGGTAVSPVTTIHYSDQVGDLYAEVQKTIDTSTSTDEYTLYDSLGRVAFQSYPCAASTPTGAAACTAGDTFAYDAMGKPTTVTHSDNSQITHSYLGAATEVQDEGNGSARVTHVYQHDGLGRLASVCEVTATTQAGTDGTPSPCGQDIAATGFLTSYQYDTLSNLLQVNQGNLAARGFSYDPLSRMVVAFNPESGTTRYVYDAAGNLLTRVRPAPNQTDPNVTVTTTYSYDALNRLLSKTYSDGTPSVSFAYDQSSADGVSLADTIGRLSSESSGATGATFSYDALGRALGNSQCTPHNCGSGMFPITYTYDLVGDPTQVVNGVGVGINQAWNRAQRVTGVTSSMVDSQHPATLLANVHYGPFGPVSGTLGNGVAESRGYTARGWLNSLRAGSLWSLSLSYQANGQVASASDSVNGSWIYGYDGLNRLRTANCSSNCPGQAAGAALDLSWNYDRYGNRWSQAVTAGSAPTPSAPFSGGNNRMDGWSYDAAGNLLYDGAHHYSYDAEGRLTAVDGGTTASYVYDAEGRRVRRTVGTFVHDLLYDLGGHAMTEMEYDSSYNGWTRGEIYAGGRHLATYVDATTDFSHGDGLGTERLRTRLNGSLYETCVSLPYGDALNCTFPNGAGDDSPLHFTGKPRDAETGLDDFGARYNSSTLGRFMTPDPAGNLVTSPADPQSWNQYAYVLNNPTTLIDPTGLLYCQPPNNKGEANCIPDSEWSSLSTDAQANYAHYDSNLDGKNGGNGTSNAFADLLALLRAGQYARQQAALAQQRQIDPDQARLNALVQGVAKDTAGFPDICSGGAFVYAGAQGPLGAGDGAGHGFAGYLGNYDSEGGWSNSGLAEGSKGNVSGGAAGGSKGVEGLAFVPLSEVGGGLIGVSKGGLSIGAYVGTPEKLPVGFGGGTYLTVSSMGACHHR